MTTTFSRRVLIFSGGQLDPSTLSYIQEGDFIIGADRGAAFLAEHHIPIHIAVGDFDSVTEQMKEKIEQACERFVACDPVFKDLTDTEMAFQLALERNPKQMLVFGVLGTRFDHSLANVHLLINTLNAGVDCRLIDPHNIIRMMNADKPLRVEQTDYTYASLLPVSPEVTGITLEGFLYPLDNATLRLGQSLAVSNELKAPIGTITISDGILLVMQSKD